ncbi:glycosyltransferase [Campylobacter lari]|uniref:glycosyltransferase family 2 protein n=1 Tax=Campylobacter lari TaxID=201 RepID=UPI00372CCC2D
MFYLEDKFFENFKIGKYLQCKNILLQLNNIRKDFAKMVIDLTKNSDNIEILELFAIVFPYFYNVKDNGSFECFVYIKYNILLAEKSQNINIDNFLDDFEILIPTYNRKKALLEAIHHIKRINKNIHIRISDNGSDDGSDESLMSLGEIYPNLHLHFNETNQGFGKNVIKLIEKTNKKFVLCISDEDFIIGPNLLEALIFMRENDVSCLRPPHLLTEDKRLGIYSVSTLETKEIPLSVIVSGFFSGLMFKTDILKEKFTLLLRDDSTIIYPHCIFMFLSMIFGKSYFFYKPLTIEKNLSLGYIGPKFEEKLNLGLSYGHPLERWRIFCSFLDFIRELKKDNVTSEEIQKINKLEQLFQNRSIVLLWNMMKEKFPILEKKYKDSQGGVGLTYKNLEDSKEKVFFHKTIQEKDTIINNTSTELKQVKLSIQNTNKILHHTQHLLSFQIKYGLAKQRIQNQLSYKLGQAMIINSKSLLGYIKMPFVLSYIKDKHNQEQKIYQEKIKKDPSLILPSLKNYPDYKEALKEKQCLTYKLGQALIQANKTWYGGGYIKLLFEIRKLKKEFKKGVE